MQVRQAATEVMCNLSSTDAMFEFLASTQRVTLSLNLFSLSIYILFPQYICVFILSTEPNIYLIDLG